jgi:hypothetical protein
MRFFRIGGMQYGALQRLRGDGRALALLLVALYQTRRPQARSDDGRGDAFMTYYHLCPLCDDSCDCEKADRDGQHCDHCDRDAMADKMTTKQMNDEENRYLNRQEARAQNRKLS